MCSSRVSPTIVCFCFLKTFLSGHVFWYLSITLFGRIKFSANVVNYPYSHNVYCTLYSTVKGDWPKTLFCCFPYFCKDQHRPTLVPSQVETTAVNLWMQTAIKFNCLIIYFFALASIDIIIFKNWHGRGRSVFTLVYRQIREGGLPDNVVLLTLEIKPSCNLNYRQLCISTNQWTSDIINWLDQLIILWWRRRLQV
jgi:hypothetical protein